MGCDRIGQFGGIAGMIGLESTVRRSRQLADTIASHLALKIADKQKLLEEAQVNTRLESIFGYMEGEIGVLQVESASAAASSARWRRPSANIISMSK